MFTSSINRKELRQGDIIEGLYYPFINCESLNLVGTVSDNSCSVTETPRLSALAKKESERELLTAQIQVSRGFSIIISQCCDLELHNGKLDLPAFVVAPLQPIPYMIRTKQEKLDVFQQNLLEQYINLFYIQKVPPLPDAYHVNFGMIVSIPHKEFNFVMSRKVLQMTDESRVHFKLKLARHFGRPTQDEIDGNLYPTS